MESCQGGDCSRLLVDGVEMRGGGLVRAVFVLIYQAIANLMKVKLVVGRW
jgi:hypothetical protein